MTLTSFDGFGHDPVGVADVTGDGKADLVTIHSNGNAYVYPGTASGRFAAAVPSFDGTFDNAFRDGQGHWVVGASDVTGDGKADLVTVHSNRHAYVYRGSASGTLGASTSSFDGTMALAVADGQTGHVPIDVSDVDGDGYSDLVTHHTDGNVYVYRGSSSGSLGNAAVSFDGTMLMGQFGAAGHQVIAALDITGDGRSDLVTAHSNGNAYVYPGTSAGTFASATVNFDGTLDTSFVDAIGHELFQMAPFPRRLACPASGCRAR